jgi:hypothetical protein
MVTSRLPCISRVFAAEGVFFFKEEFPDGENTLRGDFI